MNNEDQEKKYKKIIITLSIVLPLVIAALFGVKIPNVQPLTFLPPIYATINGFTAILLIAAVIAIKNNKRTLHESLITTAILGSILFLIMYISYHMTSEPTKFRQEGFIKYIYYFILISHILFSIAVVPLVLITFMRGKLGEFESHKKLARISFPIWLYVSITGVVVYLMISPYYA